MKMYSVKAAARLMGISEGRTRQLLADGRIKGAKIGNTWVVLKLGYKVKRNYPGRGQK